MPVDVNAARITLSNLIKLRDAAADREDFYVFTKLDNEVQKLENALNALN